MDKIEASVSVVIPFWNESSYIAQTVAEVIAFCDEFVSDYEVIMVDDGSTDQSAQKVQPFLQKSNVLYERHVVNLGKGAAVRTGVQKAQMDYILFMDADSSTNINQLTALYEWCKDYDIVIGSRAAVGADVTRESIPRKIITKLGNILIRAILGINYLDTQCGFKLFKRDVAHNLFQTQLIQRWGFDYEVLYRAHLAEIAAKEIGVYWVDTKPSSFHPFKDSIKSFWDLLYIRWKVRSN
jgi:dolichyl-phosphate beta-glucosyltransferase